MGMVIHKATLVTTWDKDMAQKARAEAKRLFPLGMVTPIVVSPINAYRSFAIMTCGSKMGWLDMKRDDDDRLQFHQWVDAQAYEDGSNALEVCTVRYGNDLPDATGL